MSIEQERDDGPHMKPEHQGILDFCLKDPEVKRHALQSSHLPREIADELLRVFLEEEKKRGGAPRYPQWGYYLRCKVYSPESYERLWEFVSPVIAKEGVYCTFLLENPAFPKHLKLQVPLSTIGTRIFQSLVRSETDPDILRYLAVKVEKLRGGEKNDVCAVFAGNPHTPTEVLGNLLKRASQSAKSRIRCLLAKHPNASPELLQKILPHAQQNLNIRENLLANPNLPPFMRLVLEAER